MSIEVGNYYFVNHNIYSISYLKYNRIIKIIDIKNKFIYRKNIIIFSKDTVDRKDHSYSNINSNFCKNLIKLTEKEIESVKLLYE